MQLLSRSDRLRRQIFQLECGGDRHTVAERPRHRAAVGVEAVDPLRHLAMFRRDTQMIGHVNAPHHQHPTFGLDLSHRLRRQIAFASWDLARLQRAPEGAGTSASRRGDQVVERRRVRCMHVGIDAIMRGDLRVNTEEHWFWLYRQVGSAQRALYALDVYPRAIDQCVCSSIDERNEFLDALFVSCVATELHFKPALFASRLEIEKDH